MQFFFYVLFLSEEVELHRGLEDVVNLLLAALDVEGGGALDVSA